MINLDSTGDEKTEKLNIGELEIAIHAGEPSLHFNTEQYPLQ